MTSRLKRLAVRGFRSLRDIEINDIGPATVMIGPNGSGKSNVLSVLQMVRLLAYGGLQVFIGRHGGSGLLMHYGPKTTRALEIELHFDSDSGENGYQCVLGHAAGDTLIFLDERAGFRSSPQADWQWTELGAGHRESRLGDEPSDVTAKTTLWLLRQLNFYHFHDTSITSELRTNARSENDRYLRSDGSNLAAYLLALKSADEDAPRAAYQRIESMVRQIAPFVRRLDPAPVNGHAVRLDWVDDRGETFGASHLSDGTLRAIALYTALGQPVGTLPMLSAIDEPELGLHPAALGLFCEAARTAAVHAQVFIATQSPALLDAFNVEDVLVAERADCATVVRRLSRPELSVWLDDYSLSNLFDRNVLGAFP